MKEMVYKNYMENGQEVIEILDEGIYKSFHYVIVSYGTHPCAYIEIPKDNVSDEDKLIDIDCHGGITYVSTTGLIKPNNENHKGLEALTRIMDVVGVAKWEDIKGHYVRVKQEDRLVVGIGNVIEDKWFEPREFFKEVENE